eukprot:3839214-Pyramimonas_sp.AAC.1
MWASSLGALGSRGARPTALFSDPSHLGPRNLRPLPSLDPRSLPRPYLVGAGSKGRGSEGGGGEG